MLYGPVRMPTSRRSRCVITGAELPRTACVLLSDLYGYLFLLIEIFLQTVFNYHRHRSRASVGKKGNFQPKKNSPPPLEKNKFNYEILGRKKMFHVENYQRHTIDGHFDDIELKIFPEKYEYKCTFCTCIYEKCEKCLVLFSTEHDCAVSAQIKRPGIKIRHWKLPTSFSDPKIFDNNLSKLQSLLFRPQKGPVFRRI